MFQKNFELYVILCNIKVETFEYQYLQFNYSKGPSLACIKKP